MDASCWVARKIFLSPAMASSSARTLDSRPTTKGVIMYGKMTTSRMGIIGKRLVSDFSLEVSMGFQVTRGSSDAKSAIARPLARLFQQGQADFLGKHHFSGYQKFAHFLVGRKVVHQV